MFYVYILALIPEPQHVITPSSTTLIFFYKTCNLFNVADKNINARLFYIAWLCPARLLVSFYSGLLNYISIIYFLFSNLTLIETRQHASTPNTTASYIYDKGIVVTVWKYNMKTWIQIQLHQKLTACTSTVPTIVVTFAVMENPS